MSDKNKNRRDSFDRFTIPPGAMTIVKKGNGKSIKLAMREQLKAGVNGENQKPKKVDE